MRLAPGSRLRASGLVVAALLGAGRAADADGPAPAPIAATVSCPAVAAPGRVRCEVTAQVGADETIPWGDVAVVAVSPSLTVLRGRVGPGDAVRREGASWTWAFALVASKQGAADVTADVRVVACRGDVCAPRRTTVKGGVQVGGGG